MTTFIEGCAIFAIAAEAAGSTFVFAPDPISQVPTRDPCEFFISQCEEEQPHTRERRPGPALPTSSGHFTSTVLTSSGTIAGDGPLQIGLPGDRPADDGPKLFLGKIFKIDSST